MSGGCGARAPPARRGGSIGSRCSTWRCCLWQWLSIACCWHKGFPMTELLYHTDAYLREFDAVVVAVDGQRAGLDRTAFYATGGGQPHDTGTLRAGGRAWQVAEVRREGGMVWHTLQGEGIPALGERLAGEIDWPRRYKLMRTHTALHLLCGVIWRDYQAAVTGGNMDIDEGRLD